MNISELISGLAALGFKKASLTPAGTVINFAGATAPDGYLVCNGAAISRTAHAKLFAAIGTLYGVGDGATTFNLPNLGGRFIRSWVPGQALDPGRSLGSTQADSLKAHAHSITMFDATLAGGNNSHPPSGGQNTVTNTATANSGDIETRPVNIAFMACIKT